MIYITKKMYKAYGKFVDKCPNLKGVEPIFNNIEIVKQYPDYDDTIGSLELAASIHKKVRKHLQHNLRPNMSLLDIAHIIELKTIELSDQNKTINKGIGFPASLSLNNCAAHFHPTSNDNTMLTDDDIIKIDFGTEVNGWIIDSAFTVCFDNKYNNLLLASKEGTNKGIKNIGVDMYINDWSSDVQEIIESYEMKVNNNILPIRPIKNLGGHNITRGNIHGGEFLPCVKMDISNKFKEGVYAIETFATIGNNFATENNDCTLYRVSNNNVNNDLLTKINDNFKTLPFTDRYIEVFNINNYKSELQKLVKNNSIKAYPPLFVNKPVAQYEHTVYINENKKIVFSKGEDY